MNDTHDNAKAAPEAASSIPNGQASLSDRVRSLRLKSSGPAPKSRGTWLPWGLAIIAIATAGVFGWRADRAASPGAPSNDSAGPSGSSSPSAEEVVLDAKGYVISPHTIQVSPQVGGEVIWLDPEFREGAIYPKGAKLAEIDPLSDFQAQLKSAHASLRIAKVNFEQVNTGSTINDIAAAELALKNMEAKLELSQIDERNKRRGGASTTNDDLEKAIIQIQVDKAGAENQRELVTKLKILRGELVRTNRDQIEVAEAAVAQAEKQLKYCIVAAPTTGIILTKKAELGGYVNPLAFGAAAGYLCEIADLRDLEIELDIQERDISRVWDGQRCRIMPEAGQRDEKFLKTHPEGYTGYVSRRMPVANRSKGAITVRVRVEFPTVEVTRVLGFSIRQYIEKSGQYLLPDMGVLVSFLK